MIILNRTCAVAMYMLTVAVALVPFRDNTAEMVGFGDIKHVDKIYEPTCLHYPHPSYKWMIMYVCVGYPCHIGNMLLLCIYVMLVPGSIPFVQTMRKLW